MDDDEVASKPSKHVHRGGCIVHKDDNSLHVRSWRSKITNQENTYASTSAAQELGANRQITCGSNSLQKVKSHIGNADGAERRSKEHALDWVGPTAVEGARSGVNARGTFRRLVYRSSHPADKQEYAGADGRLRSSSRSGFNQPIGELESTRSDLPSPLVPFVSRCSTSQTERAVVVALNAC